MSTPKAPEPLPVARENLLGTLVVVVLKAQHLIDNHKFYKQDPYVRVSLSGATKRTPVDPKGGQHPVWDAEVRLPISKEVSKKNRTMEISCWSEERKDDQLLGEAELDITETLKTGEFDDWVPLKLNGGQRGDVYFEMTFFAAGPAPLQRRASKLSPAQRLSRPDGAQGNYTHQPPTASPDVNNAALPPGHSPPRHPGQLYPDRNSQANVGRPGHGRSPSHSPLGRESALPPLPGEAAPAGVAAAPLPSILRAGPGQRPVSESRPVSGVPVHTRYPSSSPPRTGADRRYDGEASLPYPSYATPTPAASNPQPTPSTYHNRTPSSGYVPPQSTPRPSHQQSQSVGSSSQPPPSEYVSPYTSSYQAQPSTYRQSTAPEYQAPGASSYQSPPATNYQPSPAPSYQPPPASNYQPPPASSYQPPPASSYQPPANGYQPPSQPRYEPPPNQSYEHRPTSTYPPSSSPNYNQSSFNYGAPPPAVSPHPPAATPVPTNQPSRYSPPYPSYTPQQPPPASSYYPQQSQPSNPGGFSFPVAQTSISVSGPSYPYSAPSAPGYGAPFRPEPPTIPGEPDLPDPYLQKRYQTPLPLPPSPPLAPQHQYRGGAPSIPEPTHTPAPASGSYVGGFAASIPEPTHTPAPAPRPRREDADEVAARRAQEYEEARAREVREQEERDAELAKKLDMELNLGEVSVGGA
ncbi:hypothetical protein DENSPDRAFT_877428 [Dentipellis sp. KUC8613]|nr:hypothetical protein DENSPDRAFT_877428 [Dentipellis sp. KUC8613]